MRDFAIILVSHGDFSAGMLSALQMLTGEQHNIAAVSLRESMSMENLIEQLTDTANGLNTQNGLLIITDLMGGTPDNCALQLAAQNGGISVVSGANLGVVCEAALMQTLNEVSVNALVQSGRGALCNGGARIRGAMAATHKDETDL